MKTVQVTIQGTTPLLMNRFTEENEIKVSSGITPATFSSKGTPREQAQRTAYIDSNGMLYIPGHNVFRCLIAAGKSKTTIPRSNMIPAGISLRETILLFGTDKFEVDSRSVVTPSTRDRVMKHRARLDEWKLTFTLDVDETMFDLGFVRQLVDNAGRRTGLGDFRPDRKGPFGKFRVICWQEMKV